ncbi:MAG: alanine--tRNA ligase [Thermodesulfobacteriota bacterium]
MKADAVRARFVDYFKQRGHRVVPSSPLVPLGDPTLLFTNAGMVQFKSVFLGREESPSKRAVSIQKCMRAGGKHNDLDNVGRTARHHTFFEMLGNFSFGDYFKSDACAFAWEFLTQEMALEPSRLFVTVYEKDDDAAMIWEQEVRVPAERIIRMGAEDNYWSMGDTGPCGPCSEILIDQGEGTGCGEVTCKVGCECDRFLELWNLVFMESNREEDGSLTPLPEPSIDTGMGLERLAAVMQGKTNNYDSDLFAPIIRVIEELSGKQYGLNEEIDFSIKAIADHARAIAFLMADGIQPTNEGRGYLLRRVIRRAARHGKLLGMNAPFLSTVSAAVVDLMGAAYPELKMSREMMVKVTRAEEERFLETLTTGMNLLEEEIGRLKGTTLPGDVAFKLYDTYGFPIDLTTDILRDRGLGIDEAAFQEAMEEQRRRAKGAWKGSGEEETGAVYANLHTSGVSITFVGYEEKRLRSEVVAIIKGNETVDYASVGDEVEIITAATPFYGESGGQVGDIGTMTGEGCDIEVTDTKRPLGDLIVHHSTVREGEVRCGDTVELLPDLKVRRDTSRNHTATHLLNGALRAVLGSHVKQAGSLVGPSRARFDFYHFSSVDGDTIKRIEEMVNGEIRENVEVVTQVLPYQEAIDAGALAFFGDKYGEKVRFVAIDKFSRELCGGIHAERSGDIGLFKIIAESSVATGVRRIELLTGDEALRYVLEEEAILKQSSALLKSAPRELADRIERLLKQQKSLEKAVARFKEKASEGSIDALLDGVREVAGIPLLSVEIKTEEVEELRRVADRLRNKLGSGLVVLGCRKGGKALLLAAATKDVAMKVSAGAIIKELSTIVSGKGGGRADMAQGGGERGDKLPEALKGVDAILDTMVAKR